MKSIVFSTIWENVRSFFLKEEELDHKPKAVPEAASEALNKPQAATPPAQRIVEKPLPQKLPFSPDELRAALKEKQPEPAPITPAPKPVERPVERDITHEITAFETALAQAHETVRPVPQLRSTPIPQAQQQVAPPTRVPPPLQPQIEGASPFFDEFEQFLAREDMEADGILEKDILWRMKEFHKHRQEGKEYYLYSKDVQVAMNRKLGELKGLEQEWFSERTQADEIEKRLAVIEHEIESRTQELKELIRQARTRSRLERTAPQGQEFLLYDGRKLSSLLDLKAALLTMPDTVFSHHVTSFKNDFASWARSALGEAAIADEMGPLRDKQQLSAFLARLQ